MTFSEFIHMGGYGFYVWTSYALTLIVLLANILSPIFLKRKVLKDITTKAQRATRLQQ
ncbi:MAG: heme exporter protein CcmD [Gammaproteobacteria bacterium]